MTNHADPLLDIGDQLKGINETLRGLGRNVVDQSLFRDLDKDIEYIKKKKYYNIDESELMQASIGPVKLKRKKR